MTDWKTKKREIPALSEAMAELDINTGTIVTSSGSDQVKTDISGETMQASGIVP